MSSSPSKKKNRFARFNKDNTTAKRPVLSAAQRKKNALKNFEWNEESIDDFHYADQPALKPRRQKALVIRNEGDDKIFLRESLSVKDWATHKMAPSKDLPPSLETSASISGKDLTADSASISEEERIYDNNNNNHHFLSDNPSLINQRQIDERSLVWALTELTNKWCTTTEEGVAASTIILALILLALPSLITPSSAAGIRISHFSFKSWFPFFVYPL